MTTQDEEFERKIRYAKQMRASALEWRKEHANGYDVWVLETVKHLAFVNAAGLAGAVALFANSETAKQAVGPFGLQSTLYFAVGLLAAVLDMYLNSMGNLRRLREIDSRLKVWDDTFPEIPGRPAADILLAPVQWGKWFFRGAEAAGWFSALAFVAGAWPFAFLVFAGKVAS